MTCSVIGARGYTGIETARLLLSHPAAELVSCFATGSFELTHYLNSKKAKSVVCATDDQALNKSGDVVFLATPAEVSMSLAPQLIAQGKKVVDLSGAFRLKKSDYMKWYGFSHEQPELLRRAIYGLVPFAGVSSSANLVSNPGCFATAVELALIPLLKDGLIEANSIVIDAKSGTTGAGKKAVEAQMFSEVEGECLPYKVGKHQHYPEIVEAVEKFAGKKIDAHFTTSLLAVRRGIVTGIYARLATGKTAADVEGALKDAYSEYPLVEYGQVETSSELLKLKKVVGTGRAHISYLVDGEKLYVFSCIDNLMKGAASQAVENFNRLIDLPAWTGIEEKEALT